MKSRCIIGDVACVDANSQTLKESLVKMIYSNPGGVPHILHVDNGKDYTAKTMTGQNRKERKIDFSFRRRDGGLLPKHRHRGRGPSLPYQPWDKPIERFFKTVCDKFSRWFESYTGTPDGLQDLRQTAEGRRQDAGARRAADDGGVLRGLDDLEGNQVSHAGTPWPQGRGREVGHADRDVRERPRYEKRRTAQGIRGDAAHEGGHGPGLQLRHQQVRNGLPDSELGKYIGQKVGIKWDIDDVTKLYVFDQQGRKICEAVSPELLAFGPHCSQAALEKHLRDQKRQEREVREFLEDMTRPYELRTGEGGRASRRSA